MRELVCITEVWFTPAPATLQETGLLGWVRCLLDGRYKVEGLTVRRTVVGKLSVSFPYRDDAWGRRWHFLYPIDERIRGSIERQVLAQLGEVVR